MQLLEEAIKNMDDEMSLGKSEVSLRVYWCSHLPQNQYQHPLNFILTDKPILCHTFKVLDKLKQEKKIQREQLTYF